MEHAERRRVRRVCFVTGTRAEWGLMRGVVDALRRDRQIDLQIIATGMHLSRSRGHSVDLIGRDGFKIDATVPWSERTKSPNEIARETGRATSLLAEAFERLKNDIVLVVGDRVEAFAAASAAHISGKLLAHVHGGERAAGQVDDALRHAISKLAHVHFCATKRARARLIRMGEDRWRVNWAGAPGVESIVPDARSAPRSVEIGRAGALVVIHPQSADDEIEYARARLILSSVASVGFGRVVVIYPNNDPGAGGIVLAIEEIDSSDARFIVLRNCGRPEFLRLLRDACVLVGNSSSGIIEAGSFGTPVLDIGDRQKGRERGRNVAHVSYSRGAILRGLRSIWNDGSPKRYKPDNPYFRAGTAGEIVRVLRSIDLTDARIRRKLIAY